MKVSYRVGHSPLFAATDLYTRLHREGAALTSISEAGEITPNSLDVLLLDRHLLACQPLAEWQACDVALVGFDPPAGVLPLPAAACEAELLALFGFAAEQCQLKRKTRQLSNALQRKDGDLQKLVDVGLALSAEKDLDRLLNKILAEGRRLSNSDAASLFLVDKKTAEQPLLVFKLTQNS